MTGNLTLAGTTTLNDFGGVKNAVVSPDGKYVYVADSSVGGGVDVLSRNPASGALSHPLGSEGGLSGGGVAIAISPDGKFVYEAGAPSQSSPASSAIGVLERNSTTGGLTFQSMSQNVPGLRDIWSVAVSSDGRCLYATSRAEGSLGYFTRDPSTGALTPGGVLTEGAGGVTGLADAREVSVSPDGNNIYVASPGDNGVAVFARNPMTCAATFRGLVQDLFTLGQPLVNDTDGTATLPVNVATGGTLALSVEPLGAQRDARAAVDSEQPINVGPGQVQLTVSLDQQGEEELAALHKLNVQATVTFTATGGTPTTKTTVIQLIKVARFAHAVGPRAVLGARAGPDRSRGQR